MRGRPLSALCACLGALLLSGATSSSQDHESPPVVFVDGGVSPYRDSLMNDARLTMTRLDHWVRPYPFDRLVIDEVPWYDPRAGNGESGRVSVPSKWLAASRDRAASRALVVALSRLYWPGDESSTLGQGVRDYVATRTFHDQFGGTHYFTVSLFGGFATYALRPVPLTRSPYDGRPQVRRFPETGGDATVERIVDALFVLERYVGWPALQYAIADWIARDPTARSRVGFEDSLARATGRDLRWFTDAAFDPTQQFDYAIAEVTSLPSDTAPGWHDVAVTARRLGTAAFPVDIAVQFAEGARSRERWDGRDGEVTYRYRSRSPAVAAAIDPDLDLVLDADRRNNAYVLRAGWHVPAVRWTMQWGTWLQNLLLTATALI